jgi:hypothetical protein
MIKRFNTITKIREENIQVDLFIDEILEVYKKHNMSISHEDKFGAFIIEKNFDDNCKWLEYAHINI